MAVMTSAGLERGHGLEAVFLKTGNDLTDSSRGFFGCPEHFDSRVPESGQGAFAHSRYDDGVDLLGLQQGSGGEATAGTVRWLGQGFNLNNFFSPYGDYGEQIAVAEMFGTFSCKTAWGI